MTGTAYIDGPSTLGQEAINAPGHQLHEKYLVPRMITHWFDRFLTEKLLSPQQARLFAGGETSLFARAAVKDPWALVLAHRALAEWIVHFLQDRHRHAVQYYTPLATQPPPKDVGGPYTLAPSVEAVMRSVNQIAVLTHSVVRRAIEGPEDSTELLRSVHELLFDGQTDEDESNSGGGVSIQEFLARWHSVSFWIMNPTPEWLPGQTFSATE